MAARIAGCDPIIAVDRLPGRLALARELGATHTLESRGAETLAEIRKITGGGTDFALETSAVPAVFRLAVDGLRGLGTCILVGSVRARTEVSFEMPWLQGGRTVRGVIQGDSRPRDFIPRLVDLFMASRMPLDRLITRYDFADIKRAAADATSAAAIKPVLLLPRARWRISRGWPTILRLRLMCDPIWRGSRPKQNRRRHCASRPIRWFRTFDQLVASAAPFSPRRREPTDHNVLDLLN